MNKKEFFFHIRSTAFFAVSLGSLRPRILLMLSLFKLETTFAESLEPKKLVRADKLHRVRKELAKHKVVGDTR